MGKSFSALIVLIAALFAVGPASASAANVLIYGPSDGSESSVATNAGHTVTIVDEASWLAMSTAQFAAFDAIVFGDEGCGDATAESNRTTWSPAVSGRIVVYGLDPSGHDDGGGPFQTEELITNSINFAAAGPGTGLSLGCSSADAGSVVLLDQFGTFLGDGADYDTITILDPSHPVIVGPPTLVNAGLSMWGTSAHSGFTAFPTSFSAIAQGEEMASTEPVIIARNAPSTAPPSPPATTPTPPQTTTTTGLRAAALKKCARKKTKSKRRKCRKRASSLPI